MRQNFRWRAPFFSTAAASLALACSSGSSSSEGPAGSSAGSSSTGGSVSTAGSTGSAGNAGSVNQAGSSGQGGGSPAQGGGGATPIAGSNGTGGSNASAGTVGTGGITSNGGSGGSTSGGTPTADQLLAKLGTCKKIHGPFNPDGPGSGNIDVCQTGDVVWWKADMDVDCDGIQTPPCNTDTTGQPMTSIVDLAPSGDVDPTKLPYFVIPLGTPETEWYTAYGIDLGQVGAIIYKGQVIYGVFADQAGGNFIGEASYKMCSLFIGANNCDPNMGGIDPLDVTYITFTGATARASGQDIYNHDKHTALGETAAKTWLAK